MSRPRILVIDDQPRAADVLARRAPDLGFIEVSDPASGATRRHARSFREAEPFFANSRRLPDLVVLDVRFDLADEDLLPDLRPLGDGASARKLRQDRRDRQGLLILERLRRRFPDLAVVLTTAYTDIPFEEEALRLRADAFTYAVGEEETSGEGLLKLVRRILEEREAPLSTGKFFWGRSAAMRELRRRVQSLAPTPLPLLVTGPTGTGKNILVREVIHPASGRKGAFVSFDCATVPETLLQAALFGTVRGAFTGAIVDRPGVFEAARNGTLFLDEIENLTPDAQKTLLTALNEGKTRRVGSTVETPHSARVVAASNIDLAARAGEGTFRSDLLMRLNPALALELPRLSERREDLPELADLVAREFFRDPANRREALSAVRAAGGPEPDGSIELARGEDAVSASRASVVFALPAKAWTAMTRHAWPGNVRQFEMVLTDVLASALYGGLPPSIERSGRAIFSIEARMVFGLLTGARAAEAAAERFVLPRPRASSVAAFRKELERAAFRAIFHEAGGDFEKMSRLMTGSSREARAVRLRFNRLGLSAREEK
ncbi:MAG TPA: sigma 54-interacting transcriptional regulator [Thermoanaerobaculia bacterium]|nr:sigma 54-interacting transcriptional regulator [Thermoanaerobaculia bacterium]